MLKGAFGCSLFPLPSFSLLKKKQKIREKKKKKTEKEQFCLPFLLNTNVVYFVIVGCALKENLDNLF